MAQSGIATLIVNARFFRFIDCRANPRRRTTVTDADLVRFLDAQSDVYDEVTKQLPTDVNR